ncbi:MAG: RNA methyltransferase [Bacteroidetes bacterium]|nr:RNA methyltransferase [Bacteroidota bacterium]
MRQKKQRQQQQLFVAAGYKLLAEAVAAHWPMQAVIGTAAALGALPPSSIPPAGVPCYEATEAQLKLLADQEQPEGVVVLCQLPAAGPPPPGSPDACLLLQGVADPGNLGTLLRSAAWFGLRQVLCGPGCADAYNAKAVRATMGAIFRLQLGYTDDLAGWIAASTQPVWAAHLQGQPLPAVRFRPGHRLLLGSESHGVEAALLALPTVQPVHIPGTAGAESLNVASAGAILLYAWHQQVFYPHAG